MIATASPSPFSTALGFDISVTDGTPPYVFTPSPMPPNPPGVVVTSIGPPAHIDVPEDTPSGTWIRVKVTDSSTPPQIVVVASRVA